MEDSKMNYFLENNSIRIEFDEDTGAITGLINKRTNWQVIAQPKLSSIIKLLVPIGAHRNNQVLTEDQKLDAVEKNSDHQITLKWKNVSGTKSGELDIDLELRVDLNGPDLRFTMNLHNKTGSIIEEVWYPCLGGLRESKNEPSFESLSLDMCGGFHRTLMGDGFPQTCGYWGTDHPTFIKTFGAPVAQAPFVILSNTKQGIYLGMHDQQQNIVNFVHELKPGYIDSKHSRVPRTDEIGGKPVGYVVSAAQTPVCSAWRASYTGSGNPAII